jgi:ubiquinone/menaquinone biosynthesis C-methylase UbiE
VTSLEATRPGLPAPSRAGWPGVLPWLGAAVRTALLCGTRFTLWRIALPRTGFERKLMVLDFAQAMQLHQRVVHRRPVRSALRALFWRDLKTLPVFFALAPGDVWRVVRKRLGWLRPARVVPPDSFPYPDYYLYDFHHQSNGNLSRRAALTYEWQLRFLFVGCNWLMRQGVVDEVPEGAGLQILDVACGPSSWVALARRQNRRHHVVGIDLSPNYLDVARASGDFDEVRQMNAEALAPEWTARFDIVTCVWLFHELPREAQERVTAELSRVLKPGGRLVFMDSLQWSKDTPELFAMMGGRSIFAEVFNEPHMSSYLETDLEPLFARHPLRVRTTQRWFKSKVLVADKAGG